MWKKLRQLFNRWRVSKERDGAQKERTVTANPLYALGQLSRALRTGATHEDRDVRARALRRAEEWQQVLEGMRGGRLEIGSRTPMHGIPGWATLRVVAGGFATGGLAAGGSLCAHEREILDRLGLPQDERARAALNLHCLC
jgi:hypothetical protein